MKIKHAIYLLALLSISGWGPFSFFFSHPNNEPFGSDAWHQKEMQIIQSQAGNIDPKVLKLALKAYVNARNRGLDNKQLLTIIDYKRPSTEKRLWVIDLKTNNVKYNTWVTHGKNSGSIYATSFSNRPGSLQSSYGVFVTTGAPYFGENGYSLRLAGLEHGINDNAYKRAIVFHGAWYADQNILGKYGQLGRSWGCPAVSDKLAKPIIDTIKEKTLVFAYYDDQHWIRSSPFLNG